MPKLISVLKLKASAETNPRILNYISNHRLPDLAAKSKGSK